MSNENDRKSVFLFEDENLPHVRVSLILMDPSNPGSTTMIEPTEAEIANGRANLERCLPHWQATPGLVMIKPHWALIVNCPGGSLSSLGFTLHLRVVERLMGPEVPDPEYFPVFCGWNQPYASFDSDGVFAPHSFTLCFGSKGVELAREARPLVSLLESSPGTMGPTIYRRCFEPDPTRFLENLRAAVKDQQSGQGAGA